MTPAQIEAGRREYQRRLADNKPRRARMLELIAVSAERERNRVLITPDFDPGD